MISDAIKVPRPISGTYFVDEVLGVIQAGPKQTTFQAGTRKAGGSPDIGVTDLDITARLSSLNDAIHSLQDAKVISLMTTGGLTACTTVGEVTTWLSTNIGSKYEALKAAQEVAVVEESIDLYSAIGQKVNSVTGKLSKASNKSSVLAKKVIDMMETIVNKVGSGAGAMTKDSLHLGQLTGYFGDIMSGLGEMLGEVNSLSNAIKFPSLSGDLFSSFPSSFNVGGALSQFQSVSGISGITSMISSALSLPSSIQSYVDALTNIGNLMDSWDVSPYQISFDVPNWDDVVSSLTSSITGVSSSWLPTVNVDTKIWPFKDC